MINKISHIDVLDGFKTLEDESVDIVLLDPPYNIGKDFGKSKDNLSIEEYSHWSSKWLSESLRVLKKTGTGFVYGFPEIIQYIGIHIPIENQRWLFWHYTNKTIPSLNYWQRSVEIIISFWKSKEDRIFNLDDVREEYTDVFLKNAAGKKRKNTKGRYGNKETVYNANEKGAMPRDLIKVPALAGGAGKKEIDKYCKDCDELIINIEDHKNHKIIVHPTQKPMQLTRKLFNSCLSKKENNTVVIPFSGTASEVIVANELNCNFYAFENNEDYIKLGNKRLQKYGY